MPPFPLSSQNVALKLYNGIHNFHHNYRVFGFVSGFDGLEVACWPSVPKYAGSHPAEAVGFLGRKNPQHAFLRRESKAVGPMS
jgi:hypothetical protein